MQLKIITKETNFYRNNMYKSSHNLCGQWSSVHIKFHRVHYQSQFLFHTPNKTLTNSCLLRKTNGNSVSFIDLAIDMAGANL